MYSHTIRRASWHAKDGMFAFVVLATMHAPSRYPGSWKFGSRRLSTDQLPVGI